MKVAAFLIKVFLIIAYLLIISDWQNFKAGFNGKPPVTKECAATSVD